ncbi:MAG: hypothetical protein NPIRA03_02950 [Nitrospirales bacterium]|nr:MAG: hypothetical protein NPIRA03_02950 [Nitrospirales bacterium]
MIQCTLKIHDEGWKSSEGTSPLKTETGDGIGVRKNLEYIALNRSALLPDLTGAVYNIFRTG